MTARPPFLIRGLDHIVLRVADMDRAVAFYCGVLGLTEERRMPEHGIVQLRAGSALIDLIARPEPRQRATANVEHVCIGLDAVLPGELLAYLAGRGISVEEEGRCYGADGFGHSVYVRDPDGNRIELKGPRERSLPPLPELSGHGLVLRALNVSDAEALAPTYADAVSMAYWAHPPNADLGFVRMRMRRYASDPGGYSWAVTETGGTALGHINLFDISDGFAELGFLITLAGRGRGFARRAALCVLPFAFDTLKLNRVRAINDPRNHASNKALAALGFTHEGMVRGEFRYGDEMQDTGYWGLMAEDWRARKAETA